MIRPDTDDLIAFLNDALDFDRVAVSKLFLHGVPCNETMANHPTIQTGTDKATGAPRVRLLGLLNGYCGTIEGGDRHGWGPIAAVVVNVDQNDESKGQEILRFERTPTVAPTREVD